MFKLKVLKSQKGLTLVELILSLAILAIILIPLTSLFVKTMKINSDAKDVTIANQLAQQYMERWKGSTATVLNPPDQTDGKYTIRTIIQDYEPDISTGGDYALPGGAAPVIAFDTQLQIGGSGNADGINVISENGSTNSLTTIPSELNINIMRNQSLDQDIIDFGGANITYDQSSDVNIGVWINKPIAPLTLSVYNNLSENVNFYIFNTGSSGNSTVKVITKLGSVRAFYNIYDSSVSPSDNRRIYLITVSVCKGSTYSDNTKLVEIKGLKRIE